jgi:IS6 family transposase
MFKRRRFPVEIILVCVRWYCKYGISYRDLAEMILERGVDVEPSTIMRWVHRYAPELEKRVRWYQDYRAAYRFLGKALTTMRQWPPFSITTDQLGSYPRAIGRLQREGRLPGSTKHRTCKYLNNIIEADQGARSNESSDPPEAFRLSRRHPLRSRALK